MKVVSEILFRAGQTERSAETYVPRLMLLVETPEPFTLDPMPYTLDPRPYILDPRP